MSAIVDTKPLTADEQAALNWLRDENAILRQSTRGADGRAKVNEVDISGGAEALIRVLDRIKPHLHPRILTALVEALDPRGSSILQLRKRSRRGAGRPPKNTVREELCAVYDATDLRNEVAADQKKARVPAAGEKQKNIPKTESFFKRGFSKSRYYRSQKRIVD